MGEQVWCLDTSVVVKYLTPDEQEETATRLVVTALTEDVRLVAPPLAWAEVGSVLRKKLRTGLLTADEAQFLFAQYRRLPIHEVIDTRLADRAWDLAHRFNLPTLYDAAFLAAVELVPAAERAFWTADRQLLAQVQEKLPYIRSLSDFQAA